MSFTGKNSPAKCPEDPPVADNCNDRLAWCLGDPSAADTGSIRLVSFAGKNNLTKSPGDPPAVNNW